MTAQRSLDLGGATDEVVAAGGDFDRIPGRTGSECAVAVTIPDRFAAARDRSAFDRLRGVVTVGRATDLGHTASVDRARGPAQRIS